MSGSADKTRPGGGSGCLYSVLGIGVILVVIGIGIEALPEGVPSQRSEVVQQGFVPPPQPTVDPSYQPPPVADPDPQPAPFEPIGQPGLPIFWHAEWPGDPSTPCVLAAETTSAMVIHKVTLACGDGRLLVGDVERNSPAGAALGTNRSALYRANFTGQLVDADRVAFEIVVDTDAHRLSLRQTDIDLTAELYIEGLSVPVPGGPTSSTTAMSDRFVRLAVPTVVTGQIPMAVALVRGTGRSPRAADPVCELVVSPVLSDQFNCRVTMRCDGVVIYGAGTAGYNNCDIAGGELNGALDEGTTPENGDPRLDLNFRTGRVTVSDADEGSAWSATFDMLHDPRCGGARFEGSATTGNTDVIWERWELEDGTPPTMTWVRDEGVAQLDQLTLRCEDGYAYAALSDGSADLTFGPGFASIAGYASPDGAPPRGIYAFRR